MHRRIEIAEKWLQDSRKALSGVIRGKEADDQFLDYLATTSADFSGFAAEVKCRLPKAGEDVEASRYAPSSEFKHSLYVRESELKRQFESHGLGTELEENAKWLALGFEARKRSTITSIRDSHN